jgi:hypothetical protein
MMKKIEMAMLSLRPATGAFDPQKLSEEIKGEAPPFGGVPQEGGIKKGGARDENPRRETVDAG